MSRTIFLTGATGTVGSSVVSALHAAGVTAKALARSEEKVAALRARGVEPVLGDLEDPDGLGRALAGTDTLFLLAPPGPRAPEHNSNAIWAAGQAGVRRVVRLSAVKAAHDAPTRNGRLHALSDTELMASGMKWTILKPPTFMQNLLRSARTIANEGVLYSAQGDGRVGFIDTRDLAELIARFLVVEDHEGQVLAPTGPASIGYEEIAKAFSAALGKPIRYVPITLEQMRASMAGMPAWTIGSISDYMAANARGWADFVTDDVPRILGRPARSIADFARDYATSFR